MVGEPQNLIILQSGWLAFWRFLPARVSPVTVPVLICGLLTCLLVELRWFGYGETLPEKVREVLQQFDDQSRNQRTRQDKIRLIVGRLSASGW